MPFSSRRDEAIARQILLLAQLEVPAYLVSEVIAEKKGLRSYRPLEWLLRSDAMEGTLRRERRRAYLVLVRRMESEFWEIYRDQLSTANKFDLPAIFEMHKRVRRCARKMHVCAALHFLGIGVDQRSGRAFAELSPALSLRMPAAQ
jgi:hypothetical protein